VQKLRVGAKYGHPNTVRAIDLCLYSISLESLDLLPASSMRQASGRTPAKANFITQGQDPLGKEPELFQNIHIFSSSNAFNNVRHPLSI
jgi:hypothetical protein